MALYWVDLIIVTVVGLSMLTGIFRGFMKEIISLGVWVLAFWLAMTYSQIAAGWVQPYITDKTVSTVVGFLLLLVGTLIVGAIVNSTISHLLHRSGLGSIDRLLGMVFGFLRGILIVALAMLVMKMTSLPIKEYRSQSALYSTFDPLVSWLYVYTPTVLNDMPMIDPNTKAAVIQLLKQQEQQVDVISVD